MRTSTSSAAARQFASIGFMLVMTVGVAGCAAPSPVGSTPEVSSTVTSTATPLSTPAASSVTDSESCEAFGDVATILHNASVGLYEGRTGQQEYDGWMRLATRVLDRVPTRGEGDVSVAIAILKSAAPAVPTGTIASTAINTDAWNDASSLGDACNKAGYPLVTEGFTGG